MPQYKYLIVGGGMTADAAIHGIREVDAGGTIGLIGAEPHPPYDRPPLSKKLWAGKPLSTIWRHTDSLDVGLHLGRTVVSLDPGAGQVVDDQGTVYTFSKLLLATGASPRRLPFGGDEIIYFRTLDDYQRLRSMTESGQRFAVIGGGFIGSEIAAALAMNGHQVAMAFPEAGIGARVFPLDVVEFLNGYYREKGVELLTGVIVGGLDSANRRPVLTIRDGQTNRETEVAADGVVAGIGVQPNVELAQTAGLAVENGIRVSSSLRTSAPDIYAAGDVASFHNPALDRWLRVEHEDNANTMGRMAGLAMAGQSISYDHLPYFYSDMFELGYEAVGDLDPRLETFADWRDRYHEGVIYYLADGRVRGVLLWNVWGQVEAARQLIASSGPFRPSDLKGRLAT